MRTLFVFIALALLILSSTCTSAAELEVVVSGLKNQKGYVHIALFNKAKHFPYHKGIYREDKTIISNGEARLRFKKLSVGDYGVAIYHDENSNQDFDQGFLGIPLEDYGFSNNAGVFFGPPSFEAAKFKVTGALTTIKIDLDG